MRFSAFPALGCCALVSFAAAGALRAAGLASIRLTAEQETLLADGKSSAILTAQVFDDQGGIVPDGTIVRFTTTGGRLDATSATTRGGSARVTLYAADQPGVATITANLDGGTAGALGAAPVQITVSFSADAAATLTGSNWAYIEAPDYVGYAADFGVIQAIGKGGRARLAYRGLEIAADAFQLDVRENSVRASGSVRVVRGGDTRVYSNLHYNIATGEGLGERLEDGRPIPLAVRGPRLDESPPAEGTLSRDLFEPQDLSGAGVTIKARSIAVEPNVRLQFRRAEFYLDGSRVLALPFHIMALGQETLFAEQVLGVGANGLTVDFPLHYDVRPSAVGTLHVRRSARLGDSAYSQRPGWTLDLEQNYNRGAGSEGTLEVTGLTRPDWGARWTHAQRLGRDTRSHLYVDLPNHSDLFLNTVLSRTFRGFSLNATGSGSRAASLGGGDWRGQLYAETEPKSLGGAARAVRYTLNLSTGRQGFFGPNAAPGYNTYGAAVRLFTNRIVLGRATTLSPSLSLGQAWVSGGRLEEPEDGTNVFFRPRSGASILGTLSLGQNLGRQGALTVNYDYAQTPESQFGSVSGQHRLSTNLFMGQGTRWSLAVTGSQSLDQPYSTLYGNLRFALGGPWAGRIITSRSRLSRFAYSDMEFALIRRVAGRDIALYYSTTFRRFQVDLSGARF